MIAGGGVENAAAIAGLLAAARVNCSVNKECRR